jgi:hypothetical protein
MTKQSKKKAVPHPGQWILYGERRELARYQIIDAAGVTVLVRDPSGKTRGLRERAK